MTGYITRRNWNGKTWSEKQLVTPFPVTIESMEELILTTDPDYGTFVITEKNDFDVEFILEDLEGKVIDFIFVKEILPWDEV